MHKHVELSRAQNIAERTAQQIQSEWRSNTAAALLQYNREKIIVDARSRKSAVKLLSFYGG
jgi:hypothetical protein